MTLRPTNKFPRATPAALTLVAVLGLSAAFALPGNAGNTPLSCKAVLSDLGGMVEIAAYVETSQAAYGTYKMKIKSAGGNTISQAGDFEALPGERTELSQAMLSGRAKSHTVQLSVRVGGKTYSCPTTSTDI